MSKNETLMLDKEYMEKIKEFSNRQDLGLAALDKMRFEFDNNQDTIKIIINELLSLTGFGFEELPEENKKYLNKNKNCRDMWKFVEMCAKKFLTSSSGSIPDHIIYSLCLHYFQEEKPEYLPEMMVSSTLKFGVTTQDTTLQEFRITEIIKEVVKEIRVEKVVEIQREILPPDKMIILKDEIKADLLNQQSEKVIIAKTKKNIVAEQTSLFDEEEE